MHNTNKLKGVVTLFTAFTISAMAFTACQDNNSNDEQGTVKSAADSTSNDAAIAATAKKPAKKGRSSIGMTASTEEKGSTVKIVKDKDGVYKRPEIMPMYPGGEQAMASYVSDNINYEQAAIDNNTAGNIQVSFVVDENGKVSDAHVLGNKVGSGLDEEAVRVVERMPAWEPGTVKGKKVKTRLTLPITFQLEEQ